MFCKPQKPLIFSAKNSRFQFPVSTLLRRDMFLGTNILNVEIEKIKNQITKKERVI